jgi:predicted outer membrane protein
LTSCARPRLTICQRLRPDAGERKDAVSLFERYAQGGDNAKLKDWAGKTLPALQHHLQMAEQMDKSRK